MWAVCMWSLVLKGCPYLAATSGAAGKCTCQGCCKMLNLRMDYSEVLITMHFVGSRADKASSFSLCTHFYSKRCRRIPTCIVKLVQGCLSHNCNHTKHPPPSSTMHHMVHVRVVK